MMNPPASVAKITDNQPKDNEAEMNSPVPAEEEINEHPEDKPLDSSVEKTSGEQSEDKDLTLMCPPAPVEKRSDGQRQEKQRKKFKTFRRPLLVPHYLDIIKRIPFKRITNEECEKILKLEFQSKYHNLEEHPDNLFNADNTWHLAHSVSEDFHMSKGIALEFRNRYGNVEFLRSQGAKVGDVAVLYHAENVGEERFIFYLVTKALYFGKPTLYDIYCALYHLRQICEELRIKQIAMPKIGCGLDKLDYRRIKLLIHYAFKGSFVFVRIFRPPRFNKIIRH